MATIREVQLETVSTLLHNHAEDEHFRDTQIRRLQGMVTNLINDRNSQPTHPTLIINRTSQQQLCQQRSQLLYQRQCSQRELREQFEYEWRMRQTKLHREFEEMFDVRLNEALKIQHQSIHRNYQLEREKLVRRLKNYYEDEIDRLRAELRALGNMRVADMLQPQVEHDSVVESEELTGPPRLTEITTEHENTNFFFFPQSRMTSPTAISGDRFRSTSKLTVDTHNTTSSTLRTFRTPTLTENYSPRNIPKPAQTNPRDTT